MKIFGERKYFYAEEKKKRGGKYHREGKIVAERTGQTSKTL